MWGSWISVKKSERTGGEAWKKKKTGIASLPWMVQTKGDFGAIIESVGAGGTSQPVVGKGFAYFGKKPCGENIVIWDSLGVLERTGK